MTEALTESLSRLLSGDLPEEEAAALRQRIAREPEVARAWEELRALAAALAGLPEEAPPPELDARVLGRPRPAPTGPWRWALPAVALAALALLVVRPTRPVHLVVERGTQRVEGRAEVDAAGVPVRVDGVARITVEPDGPVARATSPEGSMKVLAAGGAGTALGALVTVAVLEGGARIGGPEPASIGPGEERVVRVAGPAAGPAEVPRPAVPADAPPEQRVAALQQEVDALRAELEELRFSEGVARGQLVAAQGEPVRWPDDLPPAYKPEAFEAALREAVARFPGMAVEGLDCGEYPCIATLSLEGSIEGWQDQLRELPKALPQDAYADAGVWMAVSQSDEDGHVSGTVGLAMTPPEGLSDPAIRQRTQFRGQTLLSELE